MDESYPGYNNEENAGIPLSFRADLGYTERLDSPVEVGYGNGKTLVFVDQQLVGERQQPLSEEKVKFHREILDLCGESFIDSVNKQYEPRYEGGVRLYEEFEYTPKDWQQLTPNIVWEDPFLVKGNVGKAEFTTWVNEDGGGMRIIAEVAEKYFLIDISVSKSNNTDHIALYKVGRKVDENGEIQHIPMYVASDQLYRRGRNRINLLRLIKNWSQADKPMQRLEIKRHVNWNYTRTVLGKEPTPPHFDLLESLDRRYQESRYVALPSLISDQRLP